MLSIRALRRILFNPRRVSRLFWDMYVRASMDPPAAVARRELSGVCRGPGAGGPWRPGAGRLTAVWRAAGGPDGGSEAARDGVMGCEGAR